MQWAFDSRVGWPPDEMLFCKGRAKYIPGWNALYGKVARAFHSTIPCERGVSVDEKSLRQPILLRFYGRYLSDGDTARFIASLSEHYSLGTLERMAVGTSTHVRRAAAISLGLLGNSESIPVLGPLLNHQDRKLRLVADDALRSLSSREGNAEQRQLLEQIVRCNECANFDKSVELATELIEGGKASAEVFHQRSLAFFQLDAVEHAIDDCRKVLKSNPFHYGAMIGLGHCHLELGDLLEALSWFKQALDVFPDLEPVRIQVRRLEKAIQEL